MFDLCQAVVYTDAVWTMSSLMQYLKLYIFQIDIMGAVRGTVLDQDWYV